ncbi:MAG: YceI family protein [Deltaproteobacteria bacterium]|nr:YceI family protein [Deltaproteobacteria bacterium]
MTPKRFFLAIACGLLATIYFPQRVHAAQSAQYIIDPARSELVVQLFKAGFGAAFAHDHVVRATKYSGQIELHPTAPTDARIAVEVDTTALVADEPETRRKYNLPPGLSEENRREIQETLESEGQLDVRRYPAIRFRSTGITREGKGQYTVTGDLVLRGVTRAVSFSLQAELKEEVLRGKGSGRFLQSGFGYQPYSAFLGAVKNQDEVLLHLDIVAIRQ